MPHVTVPLFAEFCRIDASHTIAALFRDHEHELAALLRPLEQLSEAEQHAISAAETAAAVARAWEVNEAALRVFIPRSPEITMALSWNDSPAATDDIIPRAQCTTSNSSTTGYTSAAVVVAHLVRDWSEEGAHGRELAHPPVLRALLSLSRHRRCQRWPFRIRGAVAACPPAALGSRHATGQLRVLVPGAGTARLAWEITRRGHRVEANDASASMITAAHSIISRRLTMRVYPRVRCMSGAMQRTACLEHADVGMPSSGRSMTRDRMPLTLQLSAWDAGYLDHSFDAVVTSYFFDVLPNPARTIRRVRELLRRGGAWINIGPLQWHDTTAGLLLLTLDEVRALLRLHGFRIRTLRLIRRVPYVGRRPRRGLARQWAARALWSRDALLRSASGSGEEQWHDCIFWVAEAAAAGSSTPTTSINRSSI